MKTLHLFRSFFRGIRISSVLLSLMMTATILIGVLTYARIRYVTTDYTTVKETTLENAYYIQSFPDPKDLVNGNFQLGGVTIEELQAIEQDPSVQKIYTIRTANPLSYKDYGISIVLYEPELLYAFPELKEMGIDFSKNPNGCVLGSQLFQGIRTGDAIELEFYQPKYSTASFTVAGHIQAPYKHLTFSSSSTNSTADYLVSAQNIIIMQATDEVISRLSSLAEINYQQNYIIAFQEGVSQEQIDTVLKKVMDKGIAVSLDDITENTQAHVSKRLKQWLPRPLFLLLSATVAYLSTVLLMVRKKEKELAVWYLCGCSKPRCSGIVFVSASILAVVPILINTAFVFLAPTLDWLGILDLSGFSVTKDALLPILGYYLITVVVCLIVTRASMAKHSPLTYLRGV